jgi:hypothetical protein
MRVQITAIESCTAIELMMELVVTLSRPASLD